MVSAGIEAKKLYYIYSAETEAAALWFCAYGLRRRDGSNTVVRRIGQQFPAEDQPQVLGFQRDLQAGEEVAPFVGPRLHTASVRGSRAPSVPSPYACSLSEAAGQPALTGGGEPSNRS